MLGAQAGAVLASLCHALEVMRAGSPSLAEAASLSYSTAYWGTTVPCLSDPSPPLCAVGLSAELASSAQLQTRVPGTDVRTGRAGRALPVCPMPHEAAPGGPSYRGGD